MEMLEKCSQKVDCVEVNDRTIKQIYDYIKRAIAFKHSSAISTLSSRHIGYDEDDFIQEIMQLLLVSLQTKKFTSFNKLKSFIQMTIKFHYLKEKRKYFYTKSRGSFVTVSLDDYLNEYRKIEDVLEDSLNVGIDVDSIDLQNLFDKNLYILFDWSTCRIGKLKDFNSYKKGYLLSINQFIKVQMIYGRIDTCKYYKQNGFYMTRNTFNIITQSILEYIKNIGFIENTEIKSYSFKKTKNLKDFIIEQIDASVEDNEVHNSLNEYALV